MNENIEELKALMNEVYDKQISLMKKLPALSFEEGLLFAEWMETNTKAKELDEISKRNREMFLRNYSAGRY